jgi:predicted nucleotidyltransferase
MLANDYQQILQTLVNHRVDFIVIGAVSAVLNGAPLNTFDVDVVHSREPENVDRLLAALKELDAFYRFQPERRIRPDTSHLISPGHQLLQTKFGHADFLGSVTKQRTYQDLLPHTTEIAITEDLSVKVLNLEMLIALKEELGQEKDLAVLPLLRRTLEERRRADSRG